jgi:type I restriction enzyme R subunit
VPPADRARNRSLFFDDLIDTKVREFNPRYTGAVEALPDSLRYLQTDSLTTGKELSLMGSVLK